MTTLDEAITLGQAAHGRISAAASDLLMFPRTDSGNAEQFAQLYGERLRYDHRRRRWLLWAEHWWQPDPDAAVRRFAKDAARQRYQDAAAIDDLGEREKEAKWAIASESRMRLDAVLSLAQAERPIADAGDQWDADPWLLGVANGVVDLHTGDLRPGRQEDRITMHSPIAFDPNPECPRWLQFLAEIFARETELIDWIRRALGYSIAGSTQEQVHFICHGSGWNGKTTMLRVLREVAGDYGHNTPFSTLEVRARQSIPNDMAALDGRRLVTASELNESTELNEARLKLLGGEDPVTARFLYGEWFTFRPAAKFWLAVNHKPRITDDSKGFWRKIRLIPFTEDFEGRTDPNLESALRTEYPGILAWLIQGCLDWQQRGLEPPGVVRAATETYRAESDPLAAFIDASCIVGANYSAGASDLYRAYRRWAEDEGMKERETLTATKFGTRMGERYEKRSTRTGIMYVGVGLLDSTQAAM